MKTLNLKLLFFLRKEKAKSRIKKCPIYLRITVDKRTEISLNKMVDPEKWDNRRQRVVGSSPEAKATNDFLKSMEVKIHNIQTVLINRGEIVNSDAIKSQLLGNSEQLKTVMYLFNYHLEQLRKAVGKNYRIATVNKYEFCKGHLQNFLWKEFGVTDLYLVKIDYYFIKQFQQYLLSESKFKNEAGEIIVKSANGHNSALKYLKMFHTVLRVGLAFNWMSNDPFALFKEKFQEVDQVFLNSEELEKMLTKDLRIDRIALVRDLFVFSCFTGLAFSDYQKLRKENISIGMNGSKWICIDRTKSRTSCKIPILPMAEQILNKYSEDPYCINTGLLLPVPSNQKLNAYLKEVGDISGINKALTSHVGRRTFATVALNYGVPAETIIKIIGHKNFNHLHLYAKTNDEKILFDLKVLAEKYGDYQYKETKLKIA